GARWHSPALQTREFGRNTACAWRVTMVMGIDSATGEHFLHLESDMSVMDDDRLRESRRVVKVHTLPTPVCSEGRLTSGEPGARRRMRGPTKKNTSRRGMPHPYPLRDVRRYPGTRGHPII
ncbi:MAG: hypothetical protein ABEI52_13155, partial [Halobacteriaceae archaeon]